MIYFTADLHFYHEKIIKHTKRPYHTVDEMNKSLIKRWNDKISYDDEVYILGDFLIKRRGGFDRSLFASVQDYMELTCQNTQFVLFHYPILEWHGFGKGAVMLHGHQHNHKEYNIDNKKSSILRYDVGVDANDMSPVSMEELIAFLFS